MGFLKFLKREKKEEKLDDLDLPPAPPPLEGFEDDKDLQMDFDKEPLQDDFPQADAGNEESFDLEAPEIPSDIDIEKPIEMPELSAPEDTYDEPKEGTDQYELPQQQEMPQEQIQATQPQRHRGLFRHESMPRHVPIGKSVYVEVESFKSSLSHISDVRSSLRKSEGELSKLESIKSAKDKSFEKLRVSLDDLQKKLIFIDKTLFKGE